MVRKLASRGATTAEIADVFQVCTRTIRRWCAQHPEFAEAFRLGAIEEFCPWVERSPAERAIGYEVDTEELKVVNGKVMHVLVRKHFPPDVGAAALFLRNVASAKWANRQETRNVREIHSSAEIRKSIEQKILDLQAAGLIDITPKNAEKSGTRRNLVADKGITKTGR
jgi:hypothetical protein